MISTLSSVISNNFSNYYVTSGFLSQILIEMSRQKDKIWRNSNGVHANFNWESNFNL